MERPSQELLMDFCRSRGIVLLADEVYHRTVYDRNYAPSFLEFSGKDDPLIVVNGFSKAWAMTGWRLGWMVTPKGYDEQMAVMSEMYNTGAPSFIQLGAIAALEEQLDTLLQPGNIPRSTITQRTGSQTSSSTQNNEELGPGI